MGQIDLPRAIIEMSILKKKMSQLIESVEVFVPYLNAIKNVDLGLNNLSCNNLTIKKGSKIYLDG